MRVDAYLGVLRGKEVLYLLCVTGDGPVTDKTPPGQAIAVHSTALGKVFLASKTDERIVTGLDQIRSRGYASVVDENIVGITSVGSPVRNTTGEVIAAVSVSFSHYFDSGLSVDHVGGIVRRSALAISGRLGAGA